MRTCEYMTCDGYPCLNEVTKKVNGQHLCEEHAEMEEEETLIDMGIELFYTE